MNKIKELRKENNLTLKELTLELNKKGLKINDGQLSKYERENQTPRNKDFWKILADFFDVSESYILAVFASDDFFKLLSAITNKAIHKQFIVLLFTGRRVKSEI